MNAYLGADMSAGRPNVGLMLKREKECASWSEGEGERERVKS